MRKKRPETDIEIMEIDEQFRRPVRNHICPNAPHPRIDIAGGRRKPESPGVRNNGRL